MGYRLSNDRLNVDIAGTDAYRGTRFDRTGFITQVQMKESYHTFCVPESLLPGHGTGGTGICNEFGLFQPVGYREAKAGEAFPKLGVGLLTRQNMDAYSFDKPYPVVPFEVDVEYRQDRISYVVHPKDCRGYAARLEKTISIRDATLTIDYRLLNTGSKKIETGEYAHNFFGIDRYSIGPEYILRFPFPVRLEPSALADMPDFMSVAGHEMRWLRVPNREFYFRLPGYESEHRPFCWELVHLPSGAGVREVSRFPVSMMALWGLSHVVSPEVFIDIRLPPGGLLEWSRVYQFFHG